MNKTDFINAVAESASMSKTDARKAVGAVLDVLTATLAKGESVVLTGFGTFEVRSVKARTGVNPRTRAKLKIPATKRPGFKAGALLKKAVK
jgi:nucleoid DNA-binding protein